VNTWKVILATLVLFGAGVGTGGLLVQHASQTRLARSPHSAGIARQTSPSAGGMRFEFLRRLERELELTPEQRERIDKILKESQENTRKILREEFQRTRAEFRQVLTPAQQVRFDELIKRPQHSRDQKRPPGPSDHAVEAASPTNAP